MDRIGHLHNSPSLKPSLRLWGEEKVDGAIYTVYLKKVRYNPATIDFSQICYLEWETIRIRIIRAGTLQKLVESLTTDSGELESTYMNIFLSTYRSFASPNQVLSILLNRYELMNGSDIPLRLKIREQMKRTLEKVLLVWLDIYPEDFYEPPQFLSLIQLKEFASKYLPGSVMELRAKHRLLKYTKSDNNQDIHGTISSDVVNHHKLISRMTNNLSFFDIPEKDFALQLTYTDSVLFKRVIPHHCLGSVWSRRDKHCSYSVSPSTVTATVNQFNVVSLRVISTILSDKSLKPVMRAKIIIKWINIAQELRLLKNFSSLKAITAALQSNSIHRLTKVWLAVPRDKFEIFTELAKIFSEENNQTNCRNLLIKEGSAKFVDTIRSNSKQLQKVVDKLPREYTTTMQGTIPYLGTFLTDLTMIDVAIPDYLPNGLINFDKRRKEFEILAQIKLLQSSANNYDIQVDEYFQEWFNSIQVFDEKESYELSCMIEAPDNSNKKHIFDNVKSSVFKWGHQKCDSLSSTSSSNGFSSEKNTNDSLSYTFKDNTSAKVSKSCSCLSLSNLSNGPVSRGLTKIAVNDPLQDFYIIKVSLEQKNFDIEGVNMYKSIMLHNSDRTRTVIKKAMDKHGIEGDPDDFCLVQMISDREIVFPDSANVYYAINPAHDFNFLLRSRFKCDTSINKKKTVK